jgi:aryl-alcohol dehydrogenase-like predicted oxidoreductase
MRLSTRPGRDEVAARRLLERAVALGVRHFDTADAYALDEGEVGHNERLLAEVLPPDAHVATKAGLRRPGGAWVPDGRAKHLRAAAEASATRLGRPADLLLLHAVDPRTPLRTSARALARILRDGHARAVGVCNVSLGQLREALEHAPLSAVQNGLSPLDARAFGSGVPAFAREHGLELQAHSPSAAPGRPRASPRNRSSPYWPRPAGSPSTRWWWPGSGTSASCRFRVRRPSRTSRRS